MTAANAIYSGARVVPISQRGATCIIIILTTDDGPISFRRPSHHRRDTISASPEYRVFSYRRGGKEGNGHASKTAAEEPAAATQPRRRLSNRRRRRDLFTATRKRPPCGCSRRVLLLLFTRVAHVHPLTRRAHSTMHRPGQVSTAAYPHRRIACTAVVLLVCLTSGKSSIAIQSL